VKVVWSPLAIERAAEEASFIARDKPEAARRWLEGIFKAIDRLERFPLSGRSVPEFDSAVHRQVTYKSHRMIYRIEGDVIEILTVRRFKRLLDTSELE